jgi:hypothetical protein
MEDGRDASSCARLEQRQLWLGPSHSALGVIAACFKQFAPILPLRIARIPDFEP